MGRSLPGRGGRDGLALIEHLAELDSRRPAGPRLRPRRRQEVPDQHPRAVARRAALKTVTTSLEPPYSLHTSLLKIRLTPAPPARSSCRFPRGARPPRASTWPARAGNRRFWLLSALRTHTTAPYKSDLMWKTLRPPKNSKRPRRVRTGRWPGALPAPTAGVGRGGSQRAERRRARRHTSGTVRVAVIVAAAAVC